VLVWAVGRRGKAAHYKPIYELKKPEPSCVGISKSRSNQRLLLAL
jgi:hypothetical protein